jgi:ABC-type multidrug transport system fused ATPase/permease subunit
MRKKISNKFDDFSKKLTSSIGSTKSLIIHSIFFVGIFCLQFLGVGTSDILLVLTTIVSLEAIYLSIFIQITVNQQGKELEEVSEELEEVSEDIEEIQKDVGEIQEDVEEISEEDEKERQEEQVEADKFKHIEDTLQSLLEKISDLQANKK